MADVHSITPSKLTTTYQQISYVLWSDMTSFDYSHTFLSLWSLKVCLTFKLLHHVSQGEINARREIKCTGTEQLSFACIRPLFVKFLKVTQSGSLKVNNSYKSVNYFVSALFQ